MFRKVLTRAFLLHLYFHKIEHFIVSPLIPPASWRIRALAGPWLHRYRAAEGPSCVLSQLGLTLLSCEMGSRRVPEPGVAAP